MTSHNSPSCTKGALRSGHRKGSRERCEPLSCYAQCVNFSQSITGVWESEELFLPPQTCYHKRSPIPLIQVLSETWLWPQFLIGCGKDMNAASHRHFASAGVELHLCGVYKKVMLLTTCYHFFLDSLLNSFFSLSATFPPGNG